MHPPSSPSFFFQCPLASQVRCLGTWKSQGAQWIDPILGFLRSALKVCLMQELLSGSGGDT